MNNDLKWIDDSKRWFNHDKLIVGILYYHILLLGICSVLNGVSYIIPIMMDTTQFGLIVISFFPYFLLHFFNKTLGPFHTALSSLDRHLSITIGVAFFVNKSDSKKKQQEIKQQTWGNNNYWDNNLHYSLRQLGTIKI